MKFSIIIASYNQQDYLPDAIESALNQTLKPFEIIVIDDGSTDHSLEIAHKYFGVKVISQVNKGLASARNTGIMNATGEYIMPLDADDILLENCLEKMADSIRQFDVDIIAPSFKTFGVNNMEVVLNPDVKFEDFKNGNYLGYFSAIRKSKLLEIGGYSPKMLWGYEDYHLWINLLSRGATVKVLKDILVLYRTKESSMIHIAQGHHDELIAQINKDFPS